MSRAAARVESTTDLTGSEADFPDDEVPGQSNMCCPLLEAAYHHSIGSCLDLSPCHRSRSALSQSCQFTLFVSTFARASTDPFFTLCDVQLEHERTSQAACLQRRHE